MFFEGLVNRNQIFAFSIFKVPLKACRYSFITILTNFESTPAGRFREVKNWKIWCPSNNFTTNVEAQSRNNPRKKPGSYNP